MAGWGLGLGRAVNLLRPRRRYMAEAAFCFGAAIASSFVWLNGLPLGLTHDRSDEGVLYVLYAALPLGLFFAIRQGLKGLGSPGVIMRPEGLQIGRKAMLPWDAVKAVKVIGQQSKRDDHMGMVVIELDAAMARRHGVKRTTHPIDVAEHEATVSYVLASLRENAAAVGVTIPGLDRLT